MCQIKLQKLQIYLKQLLDTVIFNKIPEAIVDFWDNKFIFILLIHGNILQFNLKINSRKKEIFA